jgi:hypothetical protein
MQDADSFDEFWKRRLAYWRDEEITSLREGDLRAAEIYKDARLAFYEALPKWKSLEVSHE